MTITASDLKLFAATYPDDTLTGGGRMSANVVQTSVENNVFPDIDAAARASGRVQLRKVFVAVTSADASPLLAAQADFVAGSSDANVDLVAFAYGSAGTLRPDAVTALQAAPWSWQANANSLTVSILTPVAGQPNTATLALMAGLPANAPPVGSLVAFGGGPTIFNGVFTFALQLVTWVTAASGSTATFADPVPTGGGAPYLYILPALLSTAPQMIGAALLTAASGTSSVRVNRLMARVVPNISPYPSTVSGLTDTSALKIYQGRVPIFRAGDTVVIRNGSTTEVASVTAVDYTGGLTFAAPLAHSYPTGSVVSALLQFGDLQGTVGPSFTQQTWTRSWSDSILGNPIGLSYNTITGSITTTNVGVETERWAIVFTGPTAFNLLGEDLGQIASGTTTANFAPLNPITNAPYFTIAAAGWGTGWAIGNVLRFNTTGARAPVWLARCVSPSAAGTVNTPSLEMRGSVNA